ncbi:hypothetical protein D9M68_848510 [compost metagenome]
MPLACSVLFQTPRKGSNESTTRNSVWLSFKARGRFAILSQPSGRTTFRLTNMPASSMHSNEWTGNS